MKRTVDHCSVWFMRHLAILLYICYFYMHASHTGEAGIVFIGVGPCVYVCPHNDWKTSDEKLILLGILSLDFGDIWRSTVRAVLYFKKIAYNWKTTYHKLL